MKALKREYNLHTLNTISMLNFCKKIHKKFQHQVYNIQLIVSNNQCYV